MSFCNKEIKEHILNCVNIKCDLCNNDKIVLEKKENHKKECPKRKVICRLCGSNYYYASAIENHENNHCDKRIIKCKFENCQEMVPYEDKSDHENKCDYRLMDCRYCEKKNICSKDFFEDHVIQCPFKLAYKDLKVQHLTELSPKMVDSMNFKDLLLNISDKNLIDKLKSALKKIINSESIELRKKRKREEDNRKPLVKQEKNSK